MGRWYEWLIRTKPNLPGIKMLVDRPEEFMQLALQQAETAFAAGEVPVGALIVCGGQVVAASHNLVEAEHDATEHAEIRVIRAAARRRANWRLKHCALFVTLEPCPMCMGAILLSRIEEVYFGCYDPRQGACGSVFDLSRHAGLPHQTTVYPEVLEAPCRALLTGFFESKRPQR